MKTLGADPAALSAPKLNEEAHRRLEEMIVTLELAPGSVVSETILSKRLGIGTTPIREALQRLAREHLVRIFPRRGVVVTAIDVREQLEVLETRRELERTILRCAARRATPPERTAFAELAARMEHALGRQDARAFLRFDDELNQMAARAARNEIAAQTILPLHAVSRRFWYYHHQDLPASEAATRLHVELARTIAAGDELAVAQLSDRLIDDQIAFAHATLPR